MATVWIKTVRYLTCRGSVWHASNLFSSGRLASACLLRKILFANNTNTAYANLVPKGTTSISSSCAQPCLPSAAPTTETQASA